MRKLMSEENISEYNGEYHDWICCHCGDANTTEHDCRHEDVTCESCNKQSTVSG